MVRMSAPPDQSYSSPSNSTPPAQNMSIEPEERLKRRKFLMELEAKIDALKGHEIDISGLGGMGVRIRVQHMSLDKNSDQRPNFFLPSSEYPPFDQDEELNEFYEDMAFEAPYLEAPVERARQVHGIWLDFAFNWRPGKPDINLWYAGCVADHTPYKPLTPINQSSEFGAWNIWDIRRPQGKFPHSKAAVYSNRVGKNGEILRGELLAVLRLMLGRLKKRIFIEHMTAPVFILSFMGKHARAVESYFDGEYLHLRITRLYNFPEETEPAIKIFSEWFAGDPTGDTS